MSIPGEINCEDPQFLDMFEFCLSMEISTADRILEARKTEVKQLKRKVSEELAKRKKLKEKTRKIEENIRTLKATAERLDEHISKTSIEIKSVASGVDDRSRLMSADLSAQRQVLGGYERTWQEYQRKYEELALAVTRRKIRIELEKQRVKRMVAEERIAVQRKALRNWERVSWLRMRSKIIDFARGMLDNRRMNEELAELNSSVAFHRRELEITEAQLAAERARRREEEKIRTLKILEMPPPKINISHMRSIYTRRKEQMEINRFRGYWKSHNDSSIDTISVNTTMLEEMCANEEESASILIESDVTRLRASKNPSRRHSPILANEPELNNDASETAANKELPEDEAPAEDPIPGIIYEEYENRGSEIRIEVDIRENERATVKRSAEAERSELEPKRMRPISLEPERRSIGKIGTPISTSRDVSPLKGSATRPRIVNMETVHYSIPGISRMQSGTFLKTGLERRDSNLSFDANNFEITKDSSLDGGSIADESFLEISNISPSLTEMNVSEAEQIPEAGRTLQPGGEETRKDFSKFFSSTLPKKKTGQISMF